ncbi:uncharacterized protein EV422DRAFT_325761 [Fimicolochytrium jonesii]|uniref:uncharacterized protein n=1 Tax=Fimicolochytrium jonesii TaxID=1396493 RepID=UPI0022FE1F10|nr:uncharacterized protein EV422DRAFT_325761 [Fimicolochytrium jonesii]KAI8824568.1 hypothetical protein EV422DRAFT_325761 [Fimicolochytrium jonesii]
MWKEFEMRSLQKGKGSVRGNTSTTSIRDKSECGESSHAFKSRKCAQTHSQRGVNQRFDLQSFSVHRLTFGEPKEDGDGSTRRSLCPFSVGRELWRIQSRVPSYLEGVLSALTDLRFLLGYDSMPGTCLSWFAVGLLSDPILEQACESSFWSSHAGFYVYINRRKEIPVGLQVGCEAMLSHCRPTLLGKDRVVSLEAILSPSVLKSCWKARKTHT